MAYDQGSLYKYIYEDAERMKSRTDIEKSGFFEKMRVKQVSPKRLHPNPDDEFSDPKIGPNESIMANYSKIARQNEGFRTDVFKEPIYVYKLSDGDYLILNGHHRWAGALMADVKSVRIQLQ